MGEPILSRSYSVHCTAVVVDSEKYGINNENVQSGYEWPSILALKRCLCKSLMHFEVWTPSMNQVPAIAFLALKSNQIKMHVLAFFKINFETQI